MNNLVNTIEIYSDLMTSNNHEKENLKEYLKVYRVQAKK